MLRYVGNDLIMCILRAGVAKLVYAPDSKSGELHCSCRFESDLRHHNNLRLQRNSEKHDVSSGGGCGGDFRVVDDSEVAVLLEGIEQNFFVCVNKCVALAQ